MKSKVFLIMLLVMVSIIVIVTIALKVLPNNFKKEEPAKIINKIDEYGYTLENNKSVLNKKYFDDLKSVLQGDNIDEEEYAKVVVKLFISDFYDLDNKVTKNDIGGLHYVLASARDNMSLKAKDTIYKYIENNVDGKRKQLLPIVTGVEVNSIKKTEFKYNDEIDKNAFEVTVSWTYKSDLGYQSNATITLVHEEKKLSIAQMK